MHNFSTAPYPDTFFPGVMVTNTLYTLREIKNRLDQVNKTALTDAQMVQMMKRVIADPDRYHVYMVNRHNHNTGEVNKYYTKIF